MSDEKENDEELQITVNKQTIIVGGFVGLILLSGVLVASLATLGVLDTGDDESGLDFDYPEGANSTGFQNVTAVLQSHSQSLDETSYTVNTNTTSNGEVISNNVYKYDAEDQIAFADVDSNGIVNQTVEDYQNQEQVLAERFGTENETYSRSLLQRTNPYTASFELVNFVSGISYEATSVEELSDGTRVVVYDAIEPQGRATEQIDSVSGTLRLSEDGIFRSVDLEFTGQVDNETSTQGQAIEFSNLGSTEYTEPDWYETAIEQEDPPEPTQDNGNDTDP